MTRIDRIGIALLLLCSGPCAARAQGIVPRSIADTTVVCHAVVVWVNVDTVQVAHVCAPLSWWLARVYGTVAQADTGTFPRVQERQP
jgi:hypothetical protein